MQALCSARETSQPRVDKKSLHLTLSHIHELFS